MRIPFYLLLVPSLWSQTLGIDPKAIDKSADPCVDFYQYACGTWMAKNTIPPDQAAWSRFSELSERNRTVLRGILEKAAAPGKRTASEQKIGDYYASCMDEGKAEQLGIQPLEPELKRIQAISDKASIAPELARLQSEGVRAFFGFASGPDARHASEVIAQAMQGGLSLPDRDYYLKNDEKSVTLRTKYQALVGQMLQLAGHTPERASAEAAAVVRLETELAKNSVDRVSLRDPNKRYHKMSMSEFAALAPTLELTKFAASRGVSVNSLNVAQPDFFKALDGIVAATSLDDLKAYLTWHLIRTYAPNLSSPFVKTEWDFFSGTLTGAKEMQPRWKRCVASTDQALGEAVGRVFVEQTFGAQGKEDTLRMVKEIEKEMEKDIRSLAWMSDTTKKQALAKLDSVANKIGYPEQWRDYTPVEIVRGDLVGNRMRADEFETRRRLNQIGHPVDKKEWGMTPPTVNAYYSPAMNNINFPAGILQPPFYYKGGDKAANYGAIGAVVGHELTHGFDDQGRQFDPEGNLRDWWTADDAKAFKERADCIVNEYSGFVADGDVKLNGSLTLGENAADNGGIRLAFMALQDSLAEHTLPAIDGYSPQQRFFLAYGQVWCQNQRPEAARLQALTNPHSLGRYRVNGVLQNMQEFQQVWGCKVDQPMVSKNACRVW